MNEKISIIGLGNWGTALANHLALKGYQVCGWCLEAEVANSINTHHKNLKYQTQVTLDSKFTATNDLNLALKDTNFIVLAFPSQFLGSMLPKIKVRGDETVISIIKGLDPQTLETPLESIARYLGSNIKVCCLSGPSFARDVIVGKPCGVVAASTSEDLAKEVASLFSTDRMRVYISTDPVGVEVGGIVKNVIALASGISDGLELGDSARAGLITRGLAEMLRLATAMKADPKTLFGLSGLGDLVMTATCDTSRNRTVGLRIGKGEKLQDITASLGSVAEAVTSTPLVLKLAAKHGVDMPITLQVSDLLAGKITPLAAVENLLLRPMRKEF